MIKYYLQKEKEMELKEYDTNNGVSTHIFGNSMCAYALFDSIEDALESVSYYKKPILYKGMNININKKNRVA